MKAGNKLDMLILESLLSGKNMALKPNYLRYNVPTGHDIW